MTASSHDVVTRFRQVVVDQLGVDESEVVPDASFTDDLNADSLDLVELEAATEEAFGIKIPDDDAVKLVTVQKAVDYISQHLQH